MSAAMGHRANYVVVEGGTWSLYYSRRSAITVHRDLFWGPAHALEFVRGQERTGEWLDRIMGVAGLDGPVGVRGARRPGRSSRPAARPGPLRAA